MSNSEIPVIEIHVRGGIADVVEKPEGVCVIIKDYEGKAEEKGVESVYAWDEVGKNGVVIC